MRTRVFRVVMLLLAWAIAIAVVMLFLSLPRHHVYARDGDDHGNHGDLKPWFDSLASKKGLCCSFADGQSLGDVDWDTRDDGHYTVKIAANSVKGYNGATYPAQDEWVLVPDDAVITTPNKYGPAVVWPWMNGDQLEIRCFLPGAGA